MQINITIRTIPHDKQRYATVGDWLFQNHQKAENLHVAVSAMGDWRYEALVGVHELIEALLCKAHGVDQHAVTVFDEGYEERRPEGDESEPGDDPAAPYHREHVFATQIEKLLCAEFGIDWAEYDKAVNALGQ